MKDDDHQGRSLGDAVRQGTRAVVLAQVAAQFVSFAALAFLYRRLGPEPFGLMGMVLPALLLAKMFAGFGLQEAVVQSATFSDEDRDRVFWMNQVTGLAAALTLALCGPLLAWLFGSRELIPLCLGLALTLPLTALSAVHQGWWQRKLAIASLMKVRIAAQLAGAAAACAAAWQGAGVWSLVIQQWVELAVLAGLLWQAGDWRPSWRGAVWHAALFRFGGWYTAASFCFYWAQNVDKLLLAWLVGATPAGRVAVGMYSQAYNLALKPVSLITSPASSIVLPTLARLRDDDRRFSDFTTTVWWVLAAILAPATIGIALVAPDVMALLGGGVWFSAAPMLTALSLLVIAQGLINICGSVLAAKGKARQLWQAALAQAVILSVAAGGVAWRAAKDQWTPQQSALSLAIAVAVATAGLILVPYLLYCAKVTHVVLSDFSWALLQIVGASLVMGGCVWALLGLWQYRIPPLWSLCGAASAGVLCYGLLIRDALVERWSTWWRESEI